MDTVKWLARSLLSKLRAISSSNPISGLQHYYRVAPDDNHANLFLVALLGVLDGVVQYYVHEWVKSTQNTLHLPPSIDAKVYSLVHELF